MMPTTRLRTRRDAGLPLKALLTMLFSTSLAAPSHAGWLWAVTPAGEYHRLDASTGAIQNTFPAQLPVDASGGTGLAQSAVGGTFIADVASSRIYNLRGESLWGDLPAPATGVDALGFGDTSFGPTLFALASGENQVYLLKPFAPFAGSVFASYLLDFDAAGGMDYDSVSSALYVSDVAGVVRWLNPLTGAVLGSFETGQYQTGIGIVNGRLFTVAQGADSIVQRHATTGAIIKSFPAPAPSVSGLAGQVPEPSSGGLALAAFTSFLALRRRAGSPAK